MRYALALSLPLLLTLHPCAEAQVGRDIRFISVPEAEVRSGPSNDSMFYPTNRLTRGQPVEVMQEVDGGWLKIRLGRGPCSLAPPALPASSLNMLAIL